MLKALYFVLKPYPTQFSHYHWPALCGYMFVRHSLLPNPLQNSIIITEIKLIEFNYTGKKITNKIGAIEHRPPQTWLGPTPQRVIRITPKIKSLVPGATLGIA